MRASSPAAANTTTAGSSWACSAPGWTSWIWVITPPPVRRQRSQNSHFPQIAPSRRPQKERPIFWGVRGGPLRCDNPGHSDLPRRGSALAVGGIAVGRRLIARGVAAVAVTAPVILIGLVGRHKAHVLAVDRQVGH